MAVATFLWPTQTRNWYGQGAWTTSCDSTTSSENEFCRLLLANASELEFIETLTAVKQNSPLTGLAFLEHISPLLTQKCQIVILTVNAVSSGTYIAGPIPLILKLPLQYPS